MSAPVIPAGGTIVDTFKQSFVDVPIDAENGNAIATTPFLDAAESLTTMFGKSCLCCINAASPNTLMTTSWLTSSLLDVLGSVAFSPVKNDMLGNVKVAIHWEHPIHQLKRAEADVSIPSLETP
jgi:hypothetical protein